eukprot:Gb_17258 [translate_table: standard]
MMGSFITRGLIMILGYAYPAYECYKTVEKNRPEIEQLRFWCQYWIIVAILTVLERVGDTFVSWLPMYSEAKLAFFIYLWYPKTKGTTYVYQTFLRPYVAKHETDIDRNLLEIRTRAGDITVLYWQRVSVYAQARFFDLLQYVASQSSKPQPAQNVQQPQQTASVSGSRQDPPPSGNAQPPAGSLPTQTVGSGQLVNPRRPVQPAASIPGTHVHASATGSVEEMEVDAVNVQTEQSSRQQEQNIEQAIRITRSRLRNTRGQL